MKIQNISLINFGLKKITNKKAYRRNLQNQDSFRRACDKKPQYKTPNPNDDMSFDTFENKKICVASADGNTILSKETGYHSTAIELVEFEGDKTKTTRFKTDKKGGEMSECSYKISEHGKSRRMVLNWNYPGKNFSYKGSPKDMVRLRKAIQHLRNTIHEKEYADDFGYIEDVNFQFKVALGYLQDEIDNQGKY